MNWQTKEDTLGVVDKYLPLFSDANKKKNIYEYYQNAPSKEPSEKQKKKNKSSSVTRPEYIITRLLERKKNFFHI